MLQLTKSEAIFLLDLLREMRDPHHDQYPEELEQAIEILESLINKTHGGLVV